ncbi:5-oxoprolinase subunit PxpB [Lederbergia wuyishanensis]|uniref:Inhibitor of KinA n=1 Tax=Lederbergia wuyishanensis TaxID=1347903 RepID=A0ABU0DA73_9BACI|nr:5-oxoprolinase subunit PxpB [Lederbergia wuyishanensis]MCJ8010094.1 5-oxoprolinase subunit PxpB [Lederbergia wuyishanensis]MDQ0345333.1 inhibitor of KinA [Lederbergia wuyishanensis]
MNHISFSPLGDSAIVIEFGENINLETNNRILEMNQAITNQPFLGFIEAVPAYTTLTCFYDPVCVGTGFPYETVKKELEQRVYSLSTFNKRNEKIIDIPVCYENDYSMDIEYVASYNGLTKKEVIHFHSETLYHVYFLGFAPGFPFLGGMNEKIATPRRPAPRLKVPKGAVGIAGKQTGVYPFESPGGWQIIGRTPLELFNPDRTPPSLLLPGDKVRFTPISKQEFDLLEGKQ